MIVMELLNYLKANNQNSSVITDISAPSSLQKKIMRILVVEDEKGIADFLKEGLEEESFAVDIAANGNIGLEFASTSEYDLLILDWMLPGISGIDLCRKFRNINDSVPIIFLTARDAAEDVVFGLEAGANDYIKKPFQFEELLARIRVQLRTKSGETSVFSVGDVEMNLDTHRVFRGSKEIELTPKEFALLEFLIRNKGKVCSRTNIIEHVWDIHFDSDTSVIDVYVNFLRKKLDSGGKNRELIHTIRGVGYIARDE